MGVRNSSIKKANESSGLAMSGMSHYPWCCAEPGFVVETKAPPKNREVIMHTRCLVHLRNMRRCYMACDRYCSVVQPNNGIEIPFRYSSACWFDNSKSAQKQ